MKKINLTYDDISETVLELWACDNCSSENIIYIKNDVTFCACGMNHNEAMDCDLLDAISHLKKHNYDVIILNLKG